MHPDLYLTLHQQHDRELVRDLELRRAAEACPGCIVRAQRRVAAIAARVRDGLAWRTTPAAACCPA